MKFFYLQYFFLLAILSSTSLWSYKTKSLSWEGKNWNQGDHQNTFLNGDMNLQLTMDVSHVFSVTDEVIWDVLRNQEDIWIATGSEGRVYAYHEGKERAHFNIDAQEITTMVTAGDILYLGSGPQGKIFHIPTSGRDEENNYKSPWVETGEQFVWDLKVFRNQLWVATGGERGKIFRIPLKSDKSQSLTVEKGLLPAIVLAEPNVLKIEFLEMLGVSYLYIAVSTSGKLYRIQTDSIGKDKLEVVFDAGEKDIPDFVFVGDDVYLITSGSGKTVNRSLTTGVSTDEEIADGGVISTDNLSRSIGEFAEISSVPGSDGGSFKNYLVKVNPDQKAKEVSFIYEFDKKNLTRIVYHETQNQLYLGIMEGAEIYKVDFLEKSLPHPQKIFSRPTANLSDLYLFQQDQLYFTLANLGDVYFLKPKMALQGEYTTKVFDFKKTVRWGRIVVENHNPSAPVKVFTRSGSSEITEAPTNVDGLTPVEDWSSWIEVRKGNILSPVNRFLQVKLSLVSLPGKIEFNYQPFESGSPLVKKIQIFYGQKNSSHRIKSFKIYKQDPSVFFPVEDPSQSMSLEGIFDVYSADHSLNTTFSTEDKVLIPTISPNASLLPFPKVGKKEYVLKWEVENLDQDTLVYDISYRNFSSATPRLWHKLRENFLGTQIFLDGYKFIDGVYQFRVEAHDSLQNEVGEVYSAQAVTVQQVFDNQPPQIEQVTWKDNVLRFRVRDSLSLIDSVKYSGDKRTVVLVSPEDQVYDESEETFVLEVDEVTELVIIVKDSSDNILYHNVVKNP